MNAQKMQEFDEEFNKAILSLKGILNYGTCVPKTIDEIDEDTIGKHLLLLINSRFFLIIGDLKIKNEISILYSEIRDKKVSQYLQQFLDIIQAIFLFSFHGSILGIYCL